MLKIGPAAKLLGVSKDTLRRWEASGKITSKRTRKGYRVYDPEQLKTLIKPEPKGLKIGEAAKTLGVSIDTLRRWAKKGKLKPQVAKSGYRIYDPSQLISVKQESAPQIVSTEYAYQNISEDNIQAPRPQPLIHITDITERALNKQPEIPAPLIPPSTPLTEPALGLDLKAFYTPLLTLVAVFIIALPLFLLLNYIKEVPNGSKIFQSPQNNLLAQGTEIGLKLLEGFSPSLSYRILGNHPPGSPPGYLTQNLNNTLSPAQKRDLGYLNGGKKSGSNGSVLAESTPSGSFLQLNIDTQIKGSLSADIASVSGKLFADTVNTGFGDNEVYPMDQPLLIASTPSFASLTFTSGTNQIKLSNTTISTQTGGSGAYIASIPTLSANDDFVFAALAQTLTNKTISGSSNTFSNIPISALASSAITVSAGSGLSGGGEVSLGGSITISNSGVTSITGTANQVIASAGTGGVTLSLPQDIDTGADVDFGTLTLADYLTLTQTTAPAPTTDNLYNVSGDLYWNGTNITAGGALPVGTSGQTLRHNGTSWTANSVLYNDGTNIGIGTTSPLAGLDVSLGSGTAGIAVRSSSTSATYLNFTDNTPTSIASFTRGGTSNNDIVLTAFANVNITPGSAAGLNNILTGNLKVGNGTPGVSLNGEDAYIEGTFEVDGASQFDGTLTSNGTATFNTDADFTLAGTENVSFSNSSASSTGGLIDLDSTTSSSFVAALDVSQTLTATGAVTNYGINNNWASTAVVTGASVSQTVYSLRTTASKSGADDATGTYTLYANYVDASNTGSTNAGTKNTYAGYYLATGDTAGTSTAYGMYTSASGADTNYGIYVAAGSVNIQGLTASAGVYTDSNKNLTSTVPSSGTVGYWSRSGTTLSPATSNDIVSISSNSTSSVLDLTASGTTTGSSVSIASNALTTGNALAVSSSSTAGGASGNSYLLNLSRSGANSNTNHTAYGIYSSVTNTNGTSGTNVAGYFVASGATSNNYALQTYGVASNVADSKVILFTSDLQMTSQYQSNIYASATISPGSASTANFIDLKVVPYTASANVSGATIDAIAAIPYYDGASSTIGTSRALYTKAYAANAGTTISNNYGIYVDDPDSTGTITTNYGIYIASQTGGDTTNYALYSAGTADSYFAGNLGIGDSTPTAKLDVFRNSTATSGVNQNGGYFSYTASPGSATSAGTYYDALVASASTTANGINQANTTLRGGVLLSTYAGDNTLGAANPAIASVYNTGTGTITAAYISYFNLGSNAGTITNTYGVFVGDVTTGTQTNQAYGLFVSDSSARNYFAGNVGIGSSIPTAKLYVSAGNILLDNNQIIQFKDSGGTARNLVQMTSADMQTFATTNNNTTLNGYQMTFTSALPSGQTTTDAFHMYSSSDLGVADEVFQVGDSAATFMTVLGGGNVGIGTTAPGAPFAVTNGTSGLTTGVARILASGSGASPGSGILVSNGYTTATGAGNYEIFGAYANTFGTSVFTVRDNGNIGVGDSSPDALFDIDVAASTKAMGILGSTSTGYTSQLVTMASDIGANGALLYVNPDFSGAGVQGIGLYQNATDSTTSANNNFGIYNAIALTGDAAKTATGVYTTITSNSATADNLFAYQAVTSQTGVTTTGNKIGYGFYAGGSMTGANSGGTQQVISFMSNPTVTGATTGAIEQSVDFYANGGTVTGINSATIIRYGMFINNATMNTTGTTTQYGINMAALSGADNNYGILVGNASGATAAAAVVIGSVNSSGTYGIYSNTSNSSYFAGNIGINQTTPTQPLSIQGGLRVGDSGTEAGLANSIMVRRAGADDVVYFRYIDEGTVTGTIRSGPTSSTGRKDLVFTNDASGNYYFVGSGTTCAIGTGTGGTSCTSDSRLKENVVNLSSNLDKINALRPVSFDWIDPSAPQDTHMGFLAQEVAPYFPDLVHPGANGYLSLEYAGFVTPLVGAVQELSRKVDSIDLSNGQFSINSDGYLEMGDVRMSNILVTGDVNIAGKAVASSFALDSSKFNMTGALASVSVSGDGKVSIADTVNALDSKLSDLESENASQSAQLAENKILGESAVAQAESLDEKVASTSANLATLSAQIQELLDSTSNSTDSSSLPSAPDDGLTPPEELLSATSSATLANLEVTGKVSTINLETLDATVSGTFKALGENFLGKTTIAGDLTVDGTLAVTEGNSISAFPVLFLQNNPLAQAINIFNGKVTINKEGAFTAETITASEYKTIPGKISGSGKIPAGSGSIDVNSMYVRPNSRILITPTTQTALPVSVTQKIDGEKFTASIQTPSTNDITFDWFIINEQ